MPATFQKTLDKTLDNIPNNFNFLDDILIVTEGTILKHKSDINLTLQLLDKENLAKKLEKCKFARSNITWLGYNITQNGHLSEHEKNRIHTKIRTTQNTQTNLLPYGLNTSTNQTHP